MNGEIWEEAKSRAYGEIHDVIMRTAAYERNDKTTWDKVAAAVNNFVSSRYSQLLSSWIVVCDESVNTPDIVEANKFRLVFCWRVDSSEWTVVEFTLSPSIVVVSKCRPKTP